MTEIEKELERFIASGKATTKVNSGGFQTTHIDPLKIAKHFVQWQKEQMIKDAIEGVIDGSLKAIGLYKKLPQDRYRGYEDVKVIIIKE